MAVIIAAHRAERWIEHALKSVLEQNLPAGWTLDVRIGVDACRGTANKLTDLCCDFWLANENVGPYVIRNSLIELGRADHYVIFDADDIMGKDYVRTLVGLAGEEQISGSARIAIDEHGRKLKRPVDGYHSGVCCFSHGVWEKLVAFRPWRMAADWDFIMRARKLGVRIRSSPKPLYYRRQHAGSLTRAPATSIRSDARSRLVLQGQRLLAIGDITVELVTTPLVKGLPTDLQCTAPAVVAKSIVARAGTEQGRAAHGVYTRFTYDDEALLQRRLELARATVIPCMAAQEGAAPVRWVWFAHERHREAVERAVREGGYKGALDFGARDDSEAIQTTLDSDDWISPRWLAVVQKAAPPGELAGALGPSIVYWNPLRHDLATGRWLRPARVPTWPSMFYAVYHPNDRVHVYATAHTRLEKLGAPVNLAPEIDVVALVVHDSNVHTKLKGSERKICPPFGAQLVRRRPNGSA